MCVVLHHHAILHHNTICFLKGCKWADIKWLQYVQDTIRSALPDKANVVISLVSIKAAGHLQHTVSKHQSGPPSIQVALQPLCCKLVGGEALVATMRKYCGLVCIFNVCTEPTTELVLALVTVNWWKDANQVL